MRIGYFEPLSRAWERTRVILWQPFDLTKWLLLAFAAWVAGLTTDTGSAAMARADSNDIGRQTCFVCTGGRGANGEIQWRRSFDFTLWLRYVPFHLPTSFGRFSLEHTHIVLADLL